MKEKRKVFKCKCGSVISVSESEDIKNCLVCGKALKLEKK